MSKLTDKVVSWAMKFGKPTEEYPDLSVGFAFKDGEDEVRIEILFLDEQEIPIDVTITKKNFKKETEKLDPIINDLIKKHLSSLEAQA